MLSNDFPLATEHSFETKLSPGVGLCMVFRELFCLGVSSCQKQLFQT